MKKTNKRKHGAAKRRMRRLTLADHWDEMAAKHKAIDEAWGSIVEEQAAAHGPSIPYLIGQAAQADEHFSTEELEGAL